MSVTNTTSRNVEKQTIKFAGLTSFDRREFNEDFIDANHARFLGLTDENGDVQVPELSLAEALNQLPTAAPAELLVRNPYAPDQQYPISLSNAIVNPDMMADAAFSGEGDGDEMVYATTSEKYTIVNPMEVWEPMAEAIDEAELGSFVLGEFRVYNHGASVHADVLFVDDVIEIEDRDPLFVGIQTGNSFDGSVSMYAAGFLMDGFCRNTTRYITEKKSRKHTGQPDEHREWWAEILTQMGAMRDYLGDIIEEATDVELDFISLPFNPEEFYELLGLPAYLAQSAALDAMNRSQAEGGDRYHLNSWVLHSGLTYALTHTFRGTSETGSLEDYYQIAKELLYNPALTADRVKLAYERRLQQAHGENVPAESRRELAQIVALERSLSEKKEQFLANEERMAQLIAAQHGSEDSE